MKQQINRTSNQIDTSLSKKKREILGVAGESCGAPD